MENLSIINIARQGRFTTPDDSVGSALNLLNSTKSSALPVIEFGKLLGEFDSRNLLDPRNSLNSESVLKSKVRDHITPAKSVVLPYINISDLADIMNKNDFDIVYIIHESGEYIGYATRTDVLGTLYDTLKPDSIAGMATPLGVYLTTGSIRAGAGDIALFLSGASMMVMNYISLAIILGLAWVIQHFGIFNLWDIMTLSDSSLPSKYQILREFMYLLALPLFLILFKFSVITGYHAAEHQVVHTIENGDPLDPEHVSRHQRAHPRCGTNIVTGMIIFIILSQIYGNEVAVMATVAMFVIGLKKIGALLQNYITTKPAKAYQIANGINAGNDLLRKFRSNPSYQAVGFQRIWYTGMLQTIMGASSVIALTYTIEPYIISFILK